MNWSVRQRGGGEGGCMSGDELRKGASILHMVSFPRFSKICTRNKENTHMYRSHQPLHSHEQIHFITATPRPTSTVAVTVTHPSTHQHLHMHLYLLLTRTPSETKHPPEKRFPYWLLFELPEIRLRMNVFWLMVLLLSKR